MWPRPLAIRPFRAQTAAVVCGLSLLPGSHTPRRSLRFLCLAVRTSRPQPRGGPKRRFRSRLNAPGGSYDPGFAMDEQARRATPPKRVRHPAGCSFASGCSPPRLATTQLPSATCVTTSHRSDFHLPDKTTSRTHSPAGLTRGSRDRRVKPGDDGSGWVNLVGTRANGSFPGAAEEICFGLPSIGRIGAAKSANRSYVRKIKQIWRYPHAKRTGSWLPVASFRFS